MKVKDQQTSEHQGQESANQPARKERGVFIEFISLRTREKKKKKEWMPSLTQWVHRRCSFYGQSSLWLIRRWGNID